jgi:hypothetical protein
VRVDGGKVRREGLARKAETDRIGFERHVQLPSSRRRRDRPAGRGFAGRSSFYSRRRAVGYGRDRAPRSGNAPGLPPYVLVPIVSLLQNRAAPSHGLRRTTCPLNLRTTESPRKP